MLKIYIILFVKCLLVNFGVTQQDIGDACVVARTGADGTCKIITDCPEAIADIKNRRGFPAVCGYSGNSQIVCCANSISQTSAPPPTATSTAPTTKRISAKKCDEYKEIVYENITALDFATGQPIEKRILNCASISVPLIVGGGTEARAKEFPHMALIGYGEPEDIQWLGGGSLISERFVLTAGNCLNFREVGPAKYVKLGDLWLNTADADDAKPVEVEIAKQIPYPEYKTSSHYFDIALLRLANDIQFNQYVRPICLAQTFESGTSKAISTGWSRNYWGDINNKLLKITLDYFTYKECNESYTSDINLRLKNGINDSLQVCAGSDSDSKDTCRGDSGGPLQIYHKHPCMYEIIGITSFGKVCGTSGFTGVYTRVFPYLDWIESHVWPNEN